MAAETPRRRPSHSRRIPVQKTEFLLFIIYYYYLLFIIFHYLLFIIYYLLFIIVDMLHTSGGANSSGSYNS